MKEANPKLIGVFVVGGIMLMVASLVLFSSRDLFTPKRKFVAYFQQSVNGLNVGAPVRFRGIPIGEVLRIEGIFDPERGHMTPRLILEIRPETMANAVLREGEYTLFPLLVKSGMRASLKSASLLTGQLYVSLDFHPDEPVRMLGNDKDEYPEMPTIESGFDEAIAKLSDLPLQEVLVRASGTLAAAEALLRNPDIGKTIAALPLLLANTDATVGDIRSLLNSDLANLLANSDATIGDMRRVVNNELASVLTNTDITVRDMRGFIQGKLATTTQTMNETLVEVRGSIQELIKTLNDKSLVEVGATMSEFNKTLQLAQQRLGKDDVLTFELLTTLREIGSAARSLRELADNLKQHPESLIRGKSQ